MNTLKERAQRQRFLKKLGFHFDGTMSSHGDISYLWCRESDRLEIEICCGEWTARHYIENGPFFQFVGRGTTNESLFQLLLR
jgi:hypothetical protein